MISITRIKDSKFLSKGFATRSNFTPDFDYQWLVGVTDGDGTFYFAKIPNKGVWTFTYKVGQSNYNLRLLYHIKNIVGVGSVSVPNSKDNTAEFRVRNIQHIIQYILPIFDKYPLLTSKHFQYNLFRQAILIFKNNTLSLEEKEIHLQNLKAQTLPLNYISPAWNIVNNIVYNVQDAMKVMSKPWLIGFTEAEGSFFLVEVEKRWFVHRFAITQKLDSIVMKAISLILNISFYPGNNGKISHHVVTSNKEEVSFVVKYFFKTMKGMKALEYRIWARSFNKKDHSHETLAKIQNLMRNIRSIRLDKNFKMKIR